MNKSMNGSFKPKKVYFSQVSNYALRDKELSLKAKGLYSLIQSYITIENFILYKNTLKKVCKEGNTSFESGWKELKDKGYLLQERHQNSDGTFYYMYDLLDIPVHTPKTEGVDNAGGGNEGIYSNTDINNTYLSNTYKTPLHNSTNCEQMTSPYDLDNRYMEVYLLALDRYGLKKHKRIRDINLSYLLECLEIISGEVNIFDWQEHIYKYLAELPSGNDGDILAFLRTVKRTLDVDLDDAIDRPNW